MHLPADATRIAIHFEITYLQVNFRCITSISPNVAFLVCRYSFKSHNKTFFLSVLKICNCPTVSAIQTFLCVSDTADAIPRTMGFNYIRAHCNYYNGFHDVLYGSQLIKTLAETRVRKQIAFITKRHEPIRKWKLSNDGSSKRRFQFFKIILTTPIFSSLSTTKALTSVS